MHARFPDLRKQLYRVRSNTNLREFGNPGHTEDVMADVGRIILLRLGLGLVTLLVISALIFGAVELLPGDIAQAVLGQGATDETLAALRAELGLDRPAPVRYMSWLGGAVVGDFGVSLLNQQPVPT